MTTPAAPDTKTERRDAELASLLLCLLVALYVAFLALYVPRLNNFVLSDREFTGWSGPLAERMVHGERPYVDFILPIPPGSFLVLALLEKLAGRALLLQELRVAAISHLIMGLLGYAIARQFSTRKVGLMVAFSTLVLVAQTPKECAYDHTSLLLAWGSVLTGAIAALARDPRRRRRMWFWTGVLSMSTLAFKQSTAAGAIAGWALALGYLALVDFRTRRSELRARVRDAGAWTVGVAAGSFIVLVTLLVARAPIGGFVQAVLVDGPSLKGGPRALLVNLFNFLVRHDAIRNAIVPTAVVALIALGIVRRHGSLHVGDEGEPRASISTRDAVFFSSLAILVFGTAIALLAFEVRSIDHLIRGNAEALKNIPPYGYVFGILFFVAHFGAKSDKTDEETWRGHALNAVFLSSIASSMIYDTSFVRFFAFYYNDPSIPVVLLCLFIATERSGFTWATPLVLVLSVLPLFGTKLDRALSDDVRVRDGQWAGLRINYRGVEILKAVHRAQALAGKTGTVLVLPEDLELAGLLERPRPPLLGGVVFVDQYPKRLLAHDLRALDEHPPEVFIIHPRKVEDWLDVYHRWSFESGAEKVLDHVLAKMLPKDYVLDSTYPTIYFFGRGQLDVYVRKHEEDP